MSDYGVDAIRSAALWFEPEAGGLEPVLDQIGDARLVLIGESTHGTADFYRIRAQLTQALIERRGFNIVAAEADWPDAYRANLWVRHQSDDIDAAGALGDFVRFPRWMWRNTEVVRFLTWLRHFNEGREPRQQTGFYGLDLYSLHSSIDAVLEYLQKVDPEAADRARMRYRCFEAFGEDAQSYGYAASLGITRSCEDAVVAQLTEMRRLAAEGAGRGGWVADDEKFYAEQNARLVKNAESYYRAMFGGRVESWNLRDTHMMETLVALLAHIGKHSGSAKAVVWAHNSHLGDASATQMGQFGELNLGQLVRQRYGNEACLIGFTTHTGTVTAASDWDQPASCMRVIPSLPASYEAAFHEVGLDRFVLNLREPHVREALCTPRLERAIGVIYRPDSERMSHYFTSQLPRQFDVVMHIDETEALQPLESWSAPQPDLAETYPSGL